jgi:hypothetical protein
MSKSMIKLKIKEDKKSICLEGISYFKESLKKYLIVEQKHIILIVEELEKKIDRELIVDLDITQKIREVMVKYSHNQAFLREEFEILIKVLSGHVEQNENIN